MAPHRRRGLRGDPAQLASWRPKGFNLPGDGGVRPHEPSVRERLRRLGARARHYALPRLGLLVLAACGLALLAEMLAAARAGAAVDPGVVWTVLAVSVVALPAGIFADRGNPYAHGAAGDGSTNDRAAFVSAMAAQGTLTLSPGQYLIGSSLTITADAALQPGAVIRTASALVTVHFAATFNGVLSRHFDLSLGGTVTFARAGGAYQLRPQWWGALGDGLTDDHAAIQAAVSAAVATGGGTVAFPPGDYLFGSQIAVTGGDVSLEGSRAVTLKLKGGTTLADGPAGGPTAIFVTGDNCSAVGFKFDGNKANNTQSIFAIVFEADDCQAKDLEIFDAQGGIALGQGVAFRHVLRGQIENVVVHDCGGSGVNAYGTCQQFRISNLQCYNNGVGGLEIEGNGVENPSEIAVDHYVGTGNVGQNLNCQLATNVTLSNILTMGGGANASVKFIGCTRLVWVGGVIIAPASIPTSGAPHGIWLHKEVGVLNNRNISISNVIVSHAGQPNDPGPPLNAWRGDGFRITDAAQAVRLVGCDFVNSVNGYGFAVDTVGGTLVPNDVSLIGCGFRDNALGTLDNWFAVTNSHLIGGYGLANFVNAEFNLVGDIVAAGGYRQTVDGFYQENSAASQAAVVLTRLATTTNNPTAWITPRTGSVTGVSVHSNAARTAGTLTVEVYKNGVATGLTAQINGTNTTYAFSTQSINTDTFAAGDRLDVRVTTDAAWLPVTADIRASIEVET